jgi:uncharacterized protein
MFPSRYNHFVWDTTDAISYNAKSGAFQHTTSAELAHVREALSLLPEEAGLRSLDITHQEWLRNGGFVVEGRDRELSELFANDKQDRLSNGRLSLTILPTIECNLRCPYCFQEKSRNRMSASVEKDIVAFARQWNDRQPLKSLFVTWFGGEPLLAPDTIDRLSGELLTLCGSVGAEYEASMVTNGTLLNSRNVDMLVNRNVSHLQVTIDGPGKYHDAHRPFKGGAGSSFDVITRNLDQHVKGRISTSIRINVDATNAEAALEFLDFANEMGWLSPGSKMDFGMAPIEGINSTCNVEANALLSKPEFATAVSAFRAKLLDLAPHLLINVPPPKATVCGAVRHWSFVVNPDFNFTKCWNDTGLGLVDQAPWIPNVEGDPDCSSCEILPICKGGCPAYRRDGFLDRRSWCDQRKYNLHEELRIVLTARKRVRAIKAANDLAHILQLPPQEGCNLEAGVRKSFGEDEPWEFWPKQRLPARVTIDAIDDSLRTLRNVELVQLSLCSSRVTECESA